MEKRNLLLENFPVRPGPVGVHKDHPVFSGILRIDFPGGIRYDRSIIYKDILYNCFI